MQGLKEAEFYSCQCLRCVNTSLFRDIIHNFPMIIFIVAFIHELFFFFSKSSTCFLSSSMERFDSLSMGLLRLSFRADIQRESPLFVAPRAMPYIAKLIATIKRMKSNAAMARRFVSIIILPGTRNL